jgi:hypothetical protein
MKKNGIRNLSVLSEGDIKKVYLEFGEHHFLEVSEEENGEVQLSIGYTHHGFTANAMGLPSNLEKIIEDVRKNFPETAID